MNKTLSAIIVSVLLGCSVSGNSDDAVRTAFIAHLQQIDNPAARDVLAAVSQTENTADAIHSALAKMYPEYQALTNAADAGELDVAKSKLSTLLETADKFLAADASFYVGRALMNAERFEEALPLLRDLQNDLFDYSANQGVSQYYVGQALAGMLRHDEAVGALMEFLQTNPDAPERLRVSAWRQIQELQNVKPETIQDAYHRMDFSRRRLRFAEAGEQTQEEQHRVVKILAKLIEEEEKKQCSGGQCNKPNQQSQQNQQQAQNQPQQSKSQSGGNSSNPNGRFVEKSYDTGTASPWSRLRDMSRDPANVGLKDKLPPRYRELVERYNDAVDNNSRKTEDNR